MHELSIALSILDLAEEEADNRGLGRVAAIHLRLGPLSGVVEDALQSAYQLARAGTDLEAADLVIERSSLVAHCPDCAADRVLESVQELVCPQCGAPTPDVVRGRELEVTALEIES
jgi:hydrogenase nickel incorporation protein HypA/HybF